MGHLFKDFILYKQAWPFESQVNTLESDFEFLAFNIIELKLKIMFYLFSLR